MGVLRILWVLKIIYTPLRSMLEKLYADGESHGINISTLYLGMSLPAGCGQAPDKQVALNACLGSEVVTCTVNKVCASGMKALGMAYNDLQLNNAHGCVVVVGAESMSQVPKYNGEQSGLFLDGLTDATTKQSMGLITDNLAKEMGISRADQDSFAIESYRRAIRGWRETGAFTDEICTPHPNVELSEDEEIKKFFPEKIPLLRLAFGEDGGSSITAANASSLADGASALLLCKRSYAEAIMFKPLVRIVAYADAATHPTRFPLAPALATQKMLDKVPGLLVSDIDLWEINEAFSAVVLMNIRALGLDSAKVNVDGGAVAIGHPLGMSGARIVTHMAHKLKDQGSYGLCSVCNGGGGASAVLLQKI
ncbi:hypothetical protein ACOME3_005772 [Neoechinorhynchus agilis]